MTVHPRKSFIIPVFLPNSGCPHQCAFCNQSIITGEKQSIPTSDTLRSNIRQFLSYLQKKRQTVQVSFYGGNFLGLKKNDISRLLSVATEFVNNGNVDSIRFSTRPDTIDENRLDLIRGYPVSTIELGVQSMDDRVLVRSQRGHKASDTIHAMALLKEHGYAIGLQMMTGLPGDNEVSALESGRAIRALAPEFVRIYPTVILENTHLAQLYESGEFTPMSLETTVNLVKQLYYLFHEAGIQVIRMGIQLTEDLNPESTILAGPYHPAFGHLVYSAIFLDKAVSELAAKKISRGLYDKIRIMVHPRNIPRIRGLNNNNIKILQKEYNIRSIEVIPDSSIKDDEVKIT